MLGVMRKIYVICLGMALAGCSSGEVRNTLGLNRDAPDEFRVVSRPPLSVPPDFHLQPPVPGAQPLGSPAAEDEARSIVLQDDDGASVTRILQKPSVDTAVDPVISSDQATMGESNLLSKAGTSQADPTIREQLEKERRAEPEEPKEDVSPLESWLGIEGSDPVVDPKEEAKRIRDNKDQGKPVNEGDVKTIDPKNDSVIDKVF
jgi:hypothetical protein